MQLTITADDGTVYDRFQVDRRDTRFGWLVTDSTDGTLTIDEALTAAAAWVEQEDGEVVQR